MCVRKQGRFAGESGEICGSALLATPLSGEWPQCQRIAKADGDKRADIHPHATHAHARTATYNSFMSIFSGCSVYPGKGGEETARFRSTDWFDPSLPTGSSFFASLCATSHPLCHSTFHSRLFSSNSLPDRGRGAALLLRAEHRGQCRAGYTQKGMVRRGGDCWFRSVCTPNLSQLGATSRRVFVYGQV